MIINLRNFCISQRVLPDPERTAAFGFMAAKTDFECRLTFYIAYVKIAPL